MKRITISPAALKALEAFTNGTRPQAPYFAVNTRAGFATAAATFTGAFRAIRSLPLMEQNNARIYDEDGYCLYR